MERSSCVRESAVVLSSNDTPVSPGIASSAGRAPLQQ